MHSLKKTKKKNRFTIYLVQKNEGKHAHETVNIKKKLKNKTQRTYRSMSQKPQAINKIQNSEYIRPQKRTK